MAQPRDDAGHYATTFNPEQFEEVCRRVEQGEFTAPILRELGIPKATWYDWLNDEARATRYGHAKDMGEECVLADTLAIADDGTNDWMEKLGQDGQPIGWQLNGEHVQRSKLRIDTRLKALAKYNPKRWGDKVEHSGNLTVSHEEFLAKLPDPEA